jgi:general secretion pathway protein K
MTPSALAHRIAGRRITRRRGRRGSIIVAVLWIMALVTALLLIYVKYVVATGSVVSTTTERAETEASIRAAIELTAYQLGSLKEDERPTHGAFKTRLDSTRLSVAFVSEGARLNLNAASKEFLSGLMLGLGASATDAGTYADRIVAWRSPVKSPADQAEDAFYRGLGATYVPRHAPFPTTDELWLVQGVPAPLIDRMVPLVTVFSNLASVNVIDAAPELVGALPNMTPEKLQALLNARQDPAADPKALNQQFGGDEKPSRSYRLAISADFARGQRAVAEVVILLLEDGDDPYRILSWRER